MGEFETLFFIYCNLYKTYIYYLFGKKHIIFLYLENIHIFLNNKKLL
jgi:hypothetical protein